MAKYGQKIASTNVQYKFFLIQLFQNIKNVKKKKNIIMIMRILFLDSVGG